MNLLELKPCPMRGCDVRFKIGFTAIMGPSFLVCCSRACAEKAEREYREGRRLNPADDEWLNAKLARLQAVFTSAEES